MYSDEKNALLKYFYLIDTERLAEKVQDKLNKSNSEEPEVIFQTMFSEICEACKKYIEFIYSPDSFNHADKFIRAQSNDTPSLIHLTKILKNHCILHGFQSAVKRECSSTIKISGQNDYELKHGYFGIRYDKDKSDPASGSNRNGKGKSALTSSDNAYDKTIFQKYNEYKHRFHKRPSSYSYCILKKSCSGSCKDYMTVPSYDGNWGCFIFTTPQVFTLDKNILNHSNTILTNYEKLFKDSVQWCKTYQLPSEDRVLFESAMEHIYGFRFFSYVAKLLNRVYTDSLSFNSNGITYKHLEGSTLLNIIHQAARLPIVYNRSFFLKYAIYSMISGKYLKELDYREKPTSLFSQTSKETAHPQLLLTSGLEQIHRYLQKLHYIALPLLTNVWDSLTDKLEIGNSRFFINMDKYCTYIHNNFLSIQQDCSDGSQQNQSLNHAESLESADSLWQDFSFHDTLSTKYERDSFKLLLFDYLNMNRLTPIPDLYHMITPYSDITEHQKHTVESNFYKYHMENILSFAENITPSIESNVLHQPGKC
jgi:hypothetical protein